MHVRRHLEESAWALAAAAVLTAATTRYPASGGNNDVIGEPQDSLRPFAEPGVWASECLGLYPVSTGFAALYPAPLQVAQFLFNLWMYSSLGIALSITLARVRRGWR